MQGIQGFMAPDWRSLFVATIFATETLLICFDWYGVYWELHGLLDE